MKIMVFDVPAESGGALSVLLDFYNEFKLDQENEYIFVVSLPELIETNNIRVLRFPWIKKSWLHRLYFDHFVAPNLIKKHMIVKVLSLQNVTIPHTNIYQSVLVHNALPFSDYNFSFREDHLLWVYQNIIGRSIKKSIKKSDRIIVQTNWMKKEFIEQLNINAEKIEVKLPKIDIEINEHFRETKESLSTFFYPASGVIFKNHKVIVDACLNLKEDGLDNYRVIFTLKGNESIEIKKLYEITKAENLPVYFVGFMDKEKLLNQYCNSILIFPSYIETVGLPLLEAKALGTPIVVSNCDYAHEIINNYKNAIFFDCFNNYHLKIIMQNFLTKVL